MRFLTLFFAVFFVALSLAGCGIVGLCDNKCPPGWVHGSFDCGCMEAGTPNANQQGQQQQPKPYYVIRRYYCSDDSDCTVYKNGDSCQAAKQRILDELSEIGGDPCRFCAGIRDNTGRRWTKGDNYIQDGPCRGVTSNERHLLQLGDLAPEGQTGAGKFSIVREKLAIRLAHLMRVAATAPKDNAPATCMQECAAGSPYCLPLRVNDADQGGLASLRARLKQNPSTISKSDLNDMFGVSKDECNRGDTELTGGYISNVGEGRCSIKSDVKGTVVKLDFPELLRGKWTNNNGAVEAIFNEPAARASLHFSDSYLDADWGGDIVAVYSYENFVGFSAGAKSCIRVSLE